MRLHNQTFLTGALLLFSTFGCGGNGSALGETPTLTGQVAGWSRGEQSLFAVLYGNTASKLATSTIDASGKFSITLAGGSAVTSSLQMHNPGPNKAPDARCTGTQQWDPISYGAVPVSLQTPMNVIYQLSNAGKPPSTTVNYQYFDREWNDTAELDCKNSGGGTDHTSISLHYKPGWNRVITVITPNGNTTSSQLYTGAEPEGVPWISSL